MSLGDSPMARASDNKLRAQWKATIPDHVIGVSWSPDGKLFAAGAVSGPVFVFDVNNGKTLHELKGHGFGTTAVAWQPGGNTLATAGQDGKVRIWDAVSGRELKALDGGGAWVEQLAWSPGGHLLAASAGKKTRVWDPTGNLVCELPTQPGTVTDLAWRPGTNHLAILAYGAATIYDPSGGTEPVKRFEWKGSPLKMAWSPDGSVLAHGNQDATVHFWYYDSGLDLQMHGYPTKVRELAWDFSSRYLATGGGPMACIWDCGGSKGPEGSQPQMLEGHDENVTALAYQGRGYLLGTAAGDGRVLLWQPGNKKAPKVGEHRFEDGPASAISFATLRPHRYSLSHPSITSGSTAAPAVDPRSVFAATAFSHRQETSWPRRDPFRKSACGRRPLRGKQRRHGPTPRRQSRPTAGVPIRPESIRSPPASSRNTSTTPPFPISSPRRAAAFSSPRGIRGSTIPCRYGSTCSTNFRDSAGGS